MALGFLCTSSALKLPATLGGGHLEVSARSFGILIATVLGKMHRGKAALEPVMLLT